MTTVRVPQASGSLTVLGIGVLTITNNQVDVLPALVPILLAAVPGAYTVAAAGSRATTYTTTPRTTAVRALGPWATARPGALAVRVPAAGTVQGTVTAYPADTSQPGWTYPVLDGLVLPAPYLDAASLAALIPQAVVERIPDQPDTPPTR
ncbi:hypothetical protein AB0M10_32840 [Streptomyces sp. NPDC051840]|uniref:hypothetical protein n=1 Tax=Streptomyces sp. NPDC051840 TaxID=3154752 RepID=UPI003435CEC3